MKNKQIIAILFLIIACQTPGKENKNISSASIIKMEDSTQIVNEIHSYVIKNTISDFVDTLIQNEEETHYLIRIEKEKIKLPDPKTETEVQKIIDSIVQHYQFEFNKNLEFYKNENLLEKLLERPAELSLTSSYSILNDSIISFKIDVRENFPLGTMYPYRKTIPINFSISNNKILANEEILQINDSLKILIKEHFFNPLGDSETNDSLTIDNLVEKGDFKILLTNKELILYYYEFDLKEQSYFSFAYNEVFTHLQPTVKSIIEIE